MRRLLDWWRYHRSGEQPHSGDGCCLWCCPDAITHAARQAEVGIFNAALSPVPGTVFLPADRECPGCGRGGGTKHMPTCPLMYPAPRGPVIPGPWVHASGDHQDGACAACCEDGDDGRRDEGDICHRAGLDQGYPSGDEDDPTCDGCGHSVEPVRSLIAYVMEGADRRVDFLEEAAREFPDMMTGEAEEAEELTRVINVLAAWLNREWPLPKPEPEPDE